MGTLFLSVSKQSSDVYALSVRSTQCVVTEFCIYDLNDLIAILKVFNLPHAIDFEVMNDIFTLEEKNNANK